MNWDTLLMPLITIGILALGGYGGYMTLRAEVRSNAKESDRRFSESETDRRDLRGRLEAIDKETVKRDDFQRFDDKLAARFEKIEHAVNNGASKTAQIVKDALREMLPHFRGGP